MAITTRVAESKEDRALCLRLRWTVFVEEQGVRPSLELDEYDEGEGPGAGAIHALALLDGVPAGAGRVIFPEPGVAKIQRMAVVDDVRGRGVGAALLGFLEAQAHGRGARTFTLGAQTHARGFYEKHGYAAAGDVFDDAGIPHLRMDKRST